MRIQLFAHIYQKDALFEGRGPGDLGCGYMVIKTFVIHKGIWRLNGDKEKKEGDIFCILIVRT